MADPVIDYIIANAAIHDKTTIAIELWKQEILSPLIFSGDRCYEFIQSRHGWEGRDPNRMLSSRFVDFINKKFSEAYVTVCSAHQRSNNGSNFKLYSELRCMASSRIRDYDLSWSIRQTLNNKLAASKMNKNTHLLVCNNGVLDFNMSSDGTRHVVFRPGRQDDMMTLKTNMDYKPYNPTDPNIQTVERLLTQWFTNSGEREDFLLMLGESVAGYRKQTHGNKLVELWGSGSNGKTLFYKLLAGALGEYMSYTNCIPCSRAVGVSGSRILFIGYDSRADRYDQHVGKVRLTKLIDALELNERSSLFRCSSFPTEYVSDRFGNISKNKLNLHVDRVKFKSVFSSSGDPIDPDGHINSDGCYIFAADPRFVFGSSVGEQEAMLSLLVSAFEGTIPTNIRFWTRPIKHAYFRQDWYVTHAKRMQPLFDELVATLASASSR